MSWLTKKLTDARTKLHDLKGGSTPDQVRERAVRAKARDPEYQWTGEWMLTRGGETSFHATSWDDLMAKATFRPGLKGKFLSNRSDITRKLGHGGGNNSYLIGQVRADETVFVVWWVQRDGAGDYSGLKSYYSLESGEKPSDYWLDLPHLVSAGISINKSKTVNLP